MPITKNPKELNFDHLEKLYEHKVFEDYKPKIVHARKYEEVKISSDKETFKIIDKEQRDLISLIHGKIVNYNNIEYYEVFWTFSKTPKEGGLTYLFELLINEFSYKLLSDKYHTSPGSKEFWQSLINKNKFKIYRLDLNSNYKRKAKDFKEDKIWSPISTEIIYTDIDVVEFDTEENIEIAANSDYSSDLLESLERDIKDYNTIEKPNNFQKEKKLSWEKIRLVAQKNIG